MANHLKGQTSPYLLQHSENPVNWYPWGKEAFDKAASEDKPVFLSIGYSTCHWCHVMAHESFEDMEIADILNRYYVAIKVDREERPDLDSVYMEVCQALTGSGGWPMSIFMTPDRKPFFAGTYFSKKTGRGMYGFQDLLITINEKWQHEREALLQSADRITAAIRRAPRKSDSADEQLIDEAINIYKQSYDAKYGGFGSAPKFPAPHNLIFLMQQYRKHADGELMKMAEKTLQKMYAGGIFDHIGYGFCRYSTDRMFLVPHFEKMLYDNAWLIMAYCKAYEITKRPVYLKTAEKTASYIFSEMMSSDGAFYSAQDADSEGVEGKYYLFRPEEIISLLGETDGRSFNEYYDITEKGNFEGQSIPNRLSGGGDTDRFDEFLPKVLNYRRKRSALHTDDKILTAWNCMMIAALCSLYRASREEKYLVQAKKTQAFIEKFLRDECTLFVSFREGKRSGRGFLDDYSYYIYSLLSLYDATLDVVYLDNAEAMMRKTTADFFDNEFGGFYLYDEESEELISRPKESYDGAVPSGNSVMAYCLVRLCVLRPNRELEIIKQKQLDWLGGEAKDYPSGFAMFLSAFSDEIDPPDLITVVMKNEEDRSVIPLNVPTDTIVKVHSDESQEYRLINGETTYYVCRNHCCLPPTNTLENN